MSDELNRNNEANESEEELEALEEGDIIELIDEDGKTVPFIFVDALEYEGDVYLALAEQEEEDAVFFLKIEQDEDGNDVYTAPDDELEDALFEHFVKQREQDDDHDAVNGQHERRDCLQKRKVRRYRRRIGRCHKPPRPYAGDGAGRRRDREIRRTDGHLVPPGSG